MKSLILTILFFFLCNAAVASNLETSLWGVTKSDHFIIYYQEASQDYVNKIVSYAEKYYNENTFELGFTRFEGFWTWEKRAKIYLFKNIQEYKKMSKQPAWSGAGVDVNKREIITFIGMDNFFESVLPHEIGHIIFREFVGYRRKLPLWLDEGIASYLEKRYDKERLFIVKTILNTSVFMNLGELGKVNRYNMVMPDVFYYEASSIIEFLLKVYGKEKFFDFCNALKKMPEDQDWRKALYSTYDFDSLEQLSDAWIAFLREHN